MFIYSNGIVANQFQNLIFARCSHAISAPTLYFWPRSIVDHQAHSIFSPSFFGFINTIDKQLRTNFVSNENRQTKRLL